MSSTGQGRREFSPFPGAAGIGSVSVLESGIPGMIGVAVIAAVASISLIANFDGPPLGHTGAGNRCGAQFDGRIDANLYRDSNSGGLPASHGFSQKSMASQRP